MGGAKPERPRPFPSHHEACDNQRETDHDKRYERGVNNSHEVGQQYVEIHPRLLMLDSG
jgi:hypothetical protein